MGVIPVTTTPERVERASPAQEPVEVQVEVGPGRVRIRAGDTGRAAATVTGEHAEEFTVTVGDGLVQVLAPRRRAGFLGSITSSADVDITVPAGSHLDVRTGSASVTAEGRYDRCRIRSGSGDVDLAQSTGSAMVQTGSGSVHVARALGELRVRAGSGDVTVGAAGATVGVSTGSGDVRLGRIGAATALKTGSGDVEVDRTAEELAVRTASGAVTVGELAAGHLLARTASGAVAVGVPEGVPVWTDITTTSGRIHSDLAGVGAPEEGQDHLEIRITTTSGDVRLDQR